MKHRILDSARFKHDCDNCDFLGHSLDNDLYVCATDGEIITVIARWSSDPADYISGLSLVRMDNRLAMAFGLAIERGYVVQNSGIYSAVHMDL